ncbi:MAG: gas vesicle protein [Nocardioidaceae bacterium]|nr:gas vesicle protein [Nocardioidaceae bacterium]
MTVERVPCAENVALVDLVDRLIDGGVVVTGDVVLSLAGVDLVYLGLRLVLAPAQEVAPGLSSGRSSR